MPIQDLKKLYIDELKDLYNAENQLVKALPKMAKAASSSKLREGFEEHLEQTKGHVGRLEEIFKLLKESPKGKKCKAMVGLIEEGSEITEEHFEGAVLEQTLAEEKAADEKLTKLSEEINPQAHRYIEPKASGRKVA
jgi:ferritin-like metal-binding protein YciE